MKEVTLERTSSKKTDFVSKNITPIIITYSVILSNIMERKSFIETLSVTEGKNRLKKYLCYTKRLNRKYKNSAFVYVPMIKRVIHNWLVDSRVLSFRVFGVKVSEEPICLFPMVRARTPDEVFNYVSILIKNGFIVTKDSVLDFFDSFIRIAKKSRSYKVLSFARDFIEQAKGNVDDDFLMTLNDINFWETILKESVYATIQGRSTGKGGNESKIKNPQDVYQAMIIVISLLFSHPNIGDYKPLDISFD